jgi:N-acylglucosamine-6-phosphate 2-epimerase
LGALEAFKGKLIVSCQAGEGEPLRVPGYMAKMALAAQLGGAVGIRAETPQDIHDIRAEVPLPIIGLWKVKTPGSDVYITPTIEAARAVLAAGADIVAIDCTFRKNVQGKWAWELISEIKRETNKPVLADISTLEEGINAEKHGADLISTTLSGYTSYSPQSKEPDFDLIKQLSQGVSVPVMAEGKIWTTDQARHALKCGAYGVIIGTAITRPEEITRRFVDALGNWARDGLL